MYLTLCNLSHPASFSPDIYFDDKKNSNLIKDYGKVCYHKEKRMNRDDYSMDLYFLFSSINLHVTRILPFRERLNSHGVIKHLYLNPT